MAKEFYITERKERERENQVFKSGLLCLLSCVVFAAAPKTTHEIATKMYEKSISRAHAKGESEATEVCVFVSCV